MGREHRLPRDSRVRQESDRGIARVPPALRVRLRDLKLDPSAPLVGVDVGEDFLDLAILPAPRAPLEYRRVPLQSIEADPLRILSARLLEACLGMGPRWVAMVDSPRLPLDLDWSRRGIASRVPQPKSRAIDRALLELIGRVRRKKGNGFRLSMFPTPQLAYFRSQVLVAGCKPHLAAIYRRLFGEPGARLRRKARGGVFTRFMLAGFAAYRALDRIGVRTYETYPDLQFRLWSRPGALVPKRLGAEALRSRLTIIRRMRRRLGVVAARRPTTFDEADAEILVLSAALAGRAGRLLTLENTAEGRFLVAMPDLRCSS